MTELQIGFSGLGALLVLIALRVPVGFALMIVSMFGVAALKGWEVAGGMLRTEPFDFAAHWSFSAIPMFLLNRAAWDAYSPDQKRTVWKALPGTIARTVVKGYIGDDIAAKKLAAKVGIQVNPADAKIKELWATHKKNELAVAIKNANKLKAKNAERIAGDFQKRIAKWTKIINDAGLSGMLAAAGPDPSKLDEATAVYQKLMYEHIYSKIDPTKL